MNKYTISAILFTIIFQNSLCYGFDTVKVSDKEALFSAFEETLPVITTNYIGWKRDWKWTAANIKASHNIENKQYKSTVFSGQVKKLGIRFNGSINQNANSLIWNYNWQKSSAFPNAIGFGIEFKLNLSSSSYLPELLPNNAGWSWKNADNELIEVIFSPAASKVYFERGQKNKIRVFFFSGISVGSQSSTMTVKTDGKVKFSGPDSTAYDTPNTSWHKDIMSPLTSPIDLSFLNKNDRPAGSQGFIKRENDQLFFENGSPAKFWGANIQASALFNTSSTDIKRHAKRIAKLGFNLIRIHHHDSAWVNPNIFKNQKDNTHELSASALKKIDWWIKCLKDEGVYLWLDLHVGRKFTENDGISNFSDFSKGKSHSEAKGFNYYNKDVQALMQAFNEAYLSHFNPYTKLAYKDDPAVIALLITNENDLTQHFGNALLGNKNVPVHHDIFSTDVQEFSRTFGLSKYKSSLTWLMGESKIYLSDVEHRFNQQMIEHLEGLGVKSLVSTTNSWGNMGLFGLPSLTDGSLIDAHAYGREEEFKQNPRYRPGFLTWAGASQVTGFPLSISEWNIEPFPAKDRFTAPTFVASIASLQGWDAVMLYGYSQNPLNGKGYGSNYSSYNDPAIMGVMPAAALLYRQNHVSPAKKSYELKLNRENFFFNRQDPNSSKTIRTLLETSRLTISMPEVAELPWLKNNGDYEQGSIVIDDSNKDYIPQGQNFVESDTGELKRNWEKGIHTIDTEKSQMASGWIGNEIVDLTDVTFKITTANAVVAVQSLENNPIRESNKIFITVMARSKPEKGNQLPFLSEPVNGQLEINAPKGLKLYPVNRIGKLEDEISALRDDRGRYRIKLSSKMKYHWFILQSHTPPKTNSLTEKKPPFRISFPNNGDTFYEGDSVVIKTNASKWAGTIKRVDFWKDGWKYLAGINNAPYQHTIDNLSVGTHIIRSRLIYDNGKRRDSEITISILKNVDAKNISLSEKNPPFRITSPNNGDTLFEGDSVIIKTNASKWAGTIKRVDFWKDGWKYLAGINNAPYQHTIDNLPVGTHIIRSRLIYDNGKRRDTEITITIERN